MKKDLKYIIKRILIGVGIILVMSFINSCQVHAASVGAYMTDNGTMIERPLYAQFWDCSGGTFNIATTNSDAAFGWYATDITITENGCGAGISFLSNEPIVEGVTYGLVIYMGSNNSSRWFVPSRYFGAKYTVGNNIPLSGQNFNNGIRLNTIYSSYSDGSNQLYYSNDTIGDAGTPAPYYTAAFTLVFKAVASGSYVFVPFNSGSGTQTSYTIFYGYNLTNYGQLDNLSTSDIQNVISGSGLATSSSVADLQRSVNNLQSQLSSVDSSIQQQTQQQHQDSVNTQNAINDVNDSINNSSIPSDSDSKISNITNAITSNQNSAIVQLATFIPQTLQVILNGFNTSCTGGYSLGSLYGTELTIPCINPVDYLGSFLWGVIDSILCLCYLIPLCKFLVNKYNDLTSMKNLRWQ